MLFGLGHFRGYCLFTGVLGLIHCKTHCIPQITSRGDGGIAIWPVVGCLSRHYQCGCTSIKIWDPGSWVQYPQGTWHGTSKIFRQSYERPHNIILPHRLLDLRHTYIELSTSTLAYAFFVFAFSPFRFPSFPRSGSYEDHV